MRPGARRGSALACPATLDYDDDDNDDHYSRTGPSAAAAAAAGNDGDDDDEAPLDPDAPADLSSPHVSGGGPTRVASAPPSSRRSLLSAARGDGHASNSNNNGNSNGSSRALFGRLRRAAAAKRAAAASAAAALAEQRAALHARMATAFALGGAERHHQQHHHQDKQRSELAAAAAAAAATALAAAYAHGLGPGFGPATEPGAFWRGLLHVVVTPAWALVLLLSCLCNQWQRLWRPLGGLFWGGVDLLDRRAPLLVDWALWLLGTLSLALHVAATAAALAAAALTLRPSVAAAAVAAASFASYSSSAALSSAAVPGAGSEHDNGTVALGLLGAAPPEVEGAAAAVAAAAAAARAAAMGPPAAAEAPAVTAALNATASAAAAVAMMAPPAAAETPTTAAATFAAALAAASAPRTAACCVLAFYALAHYCTAAAMFRELDLRDQGGCYFSDLVAFLGRLVDVLMHDVQLCAAAAHGNRVLEAGAQLAFRGYEEARVAAGALLFTGPSAAVLGYAHYYRGAAAALASSASAAAVAEQLKEHIQQLGDLRALATLEGAVRAAVLLCALNTLEKLLRLSAVDPWAHDPGDGFPLLYVRSHAARLPGSLVRDWLFRCRLALQDSGGRLALQDLFAYYTQQVRGGASSGLSDAHRARLLRKAAHVFSLPRAAAARQRAAAAAAAGLAAAGGLSAEDVAGAPGAYEPPGGARHATLAGGGGAGAGGGGGGGSAAPLGGGGGGKSGSSFTGPLSLAGGDGGGGDYGGEYDDDYSSGGGGPAAKAAAAASAAAARAAACAARPVALRHLAADGLRPGPKLCRMLADVLAEASYVHTVSLASNALEDGALVAVVEACFGVGGGGGAGAGGGGGKEEGGISGAGGNPDLALAHLDLSGNRVGPAGAAALARALCGPVGCRLRTLVLAGNPLRDEGAAALAEALRRGSGGHGNNGGSGSSAPPRPFPSSLPAPSSSPTPLLMLERLDLSDTGIGPEGGIALGNALRHNAALRWLSVAGSRVGAVGVEALAKSLARAGARSGLLELDVSRTGADDRSAAALAAMLATPSLPLRRLGMRGTAVTDAGARLICAAVEGNASLRAVDVADSPLMDASWGRLLSHVLKGGGGEGGGGGRFEAGGGGAGAAAAAVL